MTQKHTILIVDDEITNRLLLSEMLDEYTCIEAESGNAMWKQLENNSVDLILLDVMMPEEDGFSLGKQIIRHPHYKKIPIIYVTAKVTGDDINEGFKSGAYDYIKKPYNTIELDNRVKKALAESFITRDLKQRVITADMVFNHILECLIITNNDFVIQNANPACISLLGFDNFDLLGATLSDIVYNEEGFPLLLTSIIGKTTDIWMMSKDQKLIPVRFTLSPILDADNNEMGWSCIFQDISQQKELEQNLISAKESAEEAAKMKSAFLASMSHEIRTPLNAIIGFSDLLDDPSNTPEEVKHYIEVIKKNGGKLLAFIENLLDISAIEAQRIHIDKTPCNIRNLCQELYREFEVIKSSYNSDDIELIVVSNLPEDFTFNSDRNRLHQIMHNLLENACKFTEQGEIVFGCNINEVQNYIDFFVKDTGIGIAKDEQKNIFTNFQKVKDSKIQYSTGIGLGLSITQNLVSLLGGEIHVESELKEGSVFTVRFPLS